LRFYEKLGTILFLLLLTFGSHSFAESAENKTCNKNLTFSAYLAVTHIDNEELSLKLNDGFEWDITYFGMVQNLLKLGNIRRS
jgi:hypothetical protein